MRYIGDREIELRCGGEEGISTAKCIFVPVERSGASAKEDGDKDIKRRVKLARGQSVREGFEAPQFSVQRESQVRRDLGSRNMISRDTHEPALEVSSHMEAKTKRHVDIWGAPCRALQKHVRGSLHLSEYRRRGADFKTIYVNWQMGRWEMYREHLTRFMGELGNSEEDVEIDIRRCRGDLSNVYDGCEIKRDDSRDYNKDPSIDDEEWVKIKNYNTIELETWGHRNEFPTGGIW